ncbi:MAG TPA: radical SAM protein [Ktedonobacteraceae bacterium]|nr:radical SAM protein [Ktedonobacteraceae bacterium]
MTEILKYTRSICSACGEIVPAMYEVRDDERVFFTRSCPAHGVVDTNLGSHAAYYRKSFQVEKLMLERYGDGGDTDISGGLSPFPLRKPAGLAILEITERCNLTCPMCYAYSSPSERDYSLEEIEKRLDQLIAVEGKGISLQLSGGEPSVRKDLDSIAAMVKRKGFAQLEMVSNGIRLARDPDFAEKLVEWGFTSVYLQFDSTRPEDIIKLRGEDLWDVRVKATAALERVKLPSTLAVSLYDGLNTDQIAQTIHFAWEHPKTVCAIAFQAATPFGRFEVNPHESADSDNDGHSSMAQPHTPQKLRMPDILKLIEEQTGISEDLFFPVGEGSPLCNTFTLLKYTKNGYKPIAPNFTLQEFMEVMEVMGPRPNIALRVLTRGRSAVVPQIVSNIGGNLKLVKTLWPHIGTDPSFLTNRKTLTLYVKPFMDESDIDMSRIERCCFHNASPRGVMSFCALNAKMRPAQPHANESAFIPLPTRRTKHEQAKVHEHEFESSR